MVAFPGNDQQPCFRIVAASERVTVVRIVLALL